MGDKHITATHSPLQQMFLHKAFADFTIIAGDQQFLTHRAVLVQYDYFNALLKSNFAEEYAKQVTFPESPFLVEAMLKHIYDFPFEKGGVYSTVELMELYTAADKYQLADLMQVVLSAWKQHFKEVDRSAGHGDHAFDVHSDLLNDIYQRLAHAEDLKKDVFERHMIDHIIQRYWDEAQSVPLDLFRCLYFANADLMERTLREFLLSIQGGRLGYYQFSSFVQTPDIISARCPHCDHFWQWHMFDFDLELGCPFCGVKSRWVDYVVHAMLMPVLVLDLNPFSHQKLMQKLLPTQHGYAKSQC